MKLDKGFLAVAGVIGLAFVGLTLLAFGNPVGAFIVAGVVMIGAGL